MKYLVTRGVPQGSVLGALLFVIFINDLVERLNNFMRMYVDDTKLMSRAATIQDRERLQQDIDKCVEWARTWLMKFNVDKCKVMHVGRSNKKSTHEYTMKDEQGSIRTLSVTRVERDLGVLVSDDLKFGPQCKAAAAAAMWKFTTLNKVFFSRNATLWEILWTRPTFVHILSMPSKPGRPIKKVTLRCLSEYNDESPSTLTA
ncbi:MAG: hypothetical protein KC653_03115 [Candidatus Andersenbacteria bacterium]|nr:hypothetical protein [Candidatus Andersenbacteria bacterium]